MSSAAGIGVSDAARRVLAEVSLLDRQAAVQALRQEPAFMPRSEHCPLAVEELTDEMVAAARAEGGVLGYQRFISDARQTGYAQECYESSEALAAHLRKFAAAFDQRFSAMVERKRFVVFGDPSDELRALLGIYRAAYHTPFGSFAYWC